MSPCSIKHHLPTPTVTIHPLYPVLCLVIQSRPTLCDPMDWSLPGSSVHGDSPDKNTEVGCHALLQGIVPIQGSNLGLPHCRQILYYLSHQRSPRILEWAAYSFSRETSWPRNPDRASCIAGRFFTSWATREVHWTTWEVPKAIYTIRLKQFNYLILIQKIKHLRGLCAWLTNIF